MWYLLILFCLYALFITSCNEQFVDGQASQSGFSGFEPPSVSYHTTKQLSALNPGTHFFEFMAMVDTVKEMDAEDLENLDEEDVENLGIPLRIISDDTILLSKQALRRLVVPLRDLAKDAMTMNETRHQSITAMVYEIITPLSGFNSARRKLSTEQIKQILLEIHSADPDDGAGCELLFNKAEEFVILNMKDNFAVANAACPAGTSFIMMPGVYEGQTVYFSKKGNNWLALHNAVMDGINVVGSAFDGNFVNHLFALFEIRNYTDFGIVDREGESNNLKIRNMIFRNIGENRNGQSYGAIKILWSENLEVSNSYFENVTSAIRFINSIGPLKVFHNDALNPGRNFFQCDKCKGPGIEVFNNSMEYYERYGVNLMEDFINIFASEGEDYSPIRVNYNRARTNGLNLSPSGSFIILGDFGGKHQEAIGNIGVNPGQVGIGVASGDLILVENNRMFSTLIDGISNVAFYSWRTPSHAPACSDHKFRNNKANWICGRANVCRYGELNRGWTSGSCGLSNQELLENTYDDVTMTADIWYDTSSQNKENPNQDHGSIGSNHRDIYWFYGVYDDALPVSKPRVNH